MNIPTIIFETAVYFVVCLGFFGLFLWAVGNNGCQTFARMPPLTPAERLRMAEAAYDAMNKEQRLKVRDAMEKIRTDARVES